MYGHLNHIARLKMLLKLISKVLHCILMHKILRNITKIITYNLTFNTFCKNTYYTKTLFQKAFLKLFTMER